MRILRLCLSAGLVVVSATASAQTWTQAYEAKDYRKAADLLHPLVAQLALDPTSADPNPVRRLSIMYSEGLGVPADPVLACSLAYMATMGADAAAAKRYLGNVVAYEASVNEVRAFYTRQCERLSPRDRMLAARSVTCFAFGLRESVLNVGSEAVRLGRDGVRLAEAMPGEPDPISGCPTLFARARPLSIQPPPDAAPGVKARHFLEVLGWVASNRENKQPMTYTLQWQIYEVVAKTIVPMTVKQFDSSPRWPRPSVPPDFDARLNLEMIRSGHVHWIFDGTPPKRGWLMLSAEDQR